MMASLFTSVKGNIRAMYNRVKDNIKARYKKVTDKIIVRYRLDVNRVVQKYDAFLRHPLVTTSSFQSILDGKLNRRRRALQLTFMLHSGFYVIPRYCFVSLLYVQDEKTRLHYQYILADYNEELGMFGRTLNVIYIFFAIEMLFNVIVIRRFEGQGSLEFLTDWLKRIPKKTRIKDEDSDEITAPGELDNESRHKLISGLHYKLIAARIMARYVANAVQLFELTAFAVFIYKREPSLWITFLGLWNCITMLICLEIAGYHHYSLYLSFIVTTDYFKVVINNIIRKVEDLQTKEITNRNVTAILDDYDYMMSDFNKYNRLLKPLLRNLVYFYIFVLTALFFMFMIEINNWMLATNIVAGGGYTFMMLVTGAYVSQLCAKVTELHNTLVSLCARHAGDKRQRLSLKSMFFLKHIIQELGSLETDGQFVIGLRDGEGAATSRLEIFDLTIETVTNTLMVLGIVNSM